MKKIIINSSYAPSLINFRGDLIKKFINDGFSVICTAPDYNEKVVSQLNELGASFYLLKFQRNSHNPFSDLLYFMALLKLFLKEKPSIVLSYTIKPLIYGSAAALLSCVKTRVSLITGLGYTFNDDTSFAKKIAKFLYFIGVRCSTHVLFQNKDDLEKLKENKFVSSRNASLTNGSGVNLDEYSPQPLNHSLNLKFLMVSRLIKEKGVYDFIEVAEKIKLKYPCVEFHLVGWSDGEVGAVSKEELDNWISKDIVVFHGKLHNVKEVMAKSDVFVLPSYYPEGTPRTILEALATGRAIITTDSVGCRETVDHEYNGFLIPIKSPSILYQMVETLILNPSLVEIFGRNSLKIAQSKYDVEIVNNQIFDFIGLT